MQWVAYEMQEGRLDDLVVLITRPEHFEQRWGLHRGKASLG